MQIEKIYTYPVKALQPVEVESSRITKNGLDYDRYFMLVEIVQNDDGSEKVENVHVSGHPESTLFFPKLNLSENEETSPSSMTVTFKPAEGNPRDITFPLTPDTSTLESIDIIMHQSPSSAYKMPQHINDWFSSCYNKTMILTYLGSNRRPVLMTSDAESVRAVGDSKQPIPATPATRSTGWLSSITSTATSYLFSAPITPEPNTITFADCAPLLIVSSASLADLHPRLPDNHKMDITKFRPNIIISGASAAWDEDFWAQLIITSQSPLSPSTSPSAAAEAAEPVETGIECIHNCGRCKSINIDYATGKPGTGPTGSMLKRMQADRRVDPGFKYSPVFGRYSFLRKGDEGHVVRQGDEVRVGRRNERRSVFDWPGMATT